MSTDQIGFVGLGAMGMGMAKSLRRAGYSVHVFDLRREVAEAFAAEGGVACSSPAEIGHGLRGRDQRCGQRGANRSCFVWMKVVRPQP